MNNFSKKLFSPENKNFLFRNLPIMLALLLGVGISLTLGYSMGHKKGLTEIGYGGDSKQLGETVKQQKADLEIMNKQYNATVQERDVAVSNSNKFYQALNDETARLSLLSAVSTSYSDLLRKSGGVELSVQNLEVKPLSENEFEYVLDLVQISPTKRPTSVTVGLVLIRGGENRSIPMQNSMFNFDEYQRITGRWTMEKGFEPNQIEVRLSGMTPKRFTWQRGKKTTVMPEVASTPSTTQS